MNQTEVLILHIINTEHITEFICQKIIVYSFSDHSYSDVILADDFNGTPQTKTFPQTTSDDLQTITFEVSIFEDNVVEGEEVFVVLLETSGGSVTITRSCTIVRIQETFSGESKFEFLTINALFIIM